MAATESQGASRLLATTRTSYKNTSQIPSSITAEAARNRPVKNVRLTQPTPDFVNPTLSRKLVIVDNHINKSPLMENH